jgi:hypothetical protein
LLPVIPEPSSSNLPPPPRISLMSRNTSTPRINFNELKQQSSSRGKGKIVKSKTIQVQSSVKTRKAVKFDFYLLPENGEQGPPQLPKRFQDDGLWKDMNKAGYIKTLEFIQDDREYCMTIIERGFAEFRLNGFQFWRPKGTKMESHGPPEEDFNLKFLKE